MRPNQDLAHVLSASVRGLSDLMARDRPDWVIVQGDTTTTLAGALAGFYNRARVGHVEAGLRTGNRRSPFPEETNRLLTTHLADLHFAPTEGARRNLLREGIDPKAIVFVTGNTVVDALLRTRDLASFARGSRAPVPASAYILVTTHRRENHGDALLRICDAVRELLERHPLTLVWVPMHPNPRVRDVLSERLGGHARTLLSEPLCYTAFVRALENAALVLTDSGRGAGRVHRARQAGAGSCASTPNGPRRSKQASRRSSARTLRRSSRRRRACWAGRALAR
jgi:UDP-N-acetylglucosamine 2-epimerase (non-hydrolysing)